IAASISRDPEQLGKPLDLARIQPHAVVLAVIECELLTIRDLHLAAADRTHGRAPRPPARILRRLLLDCTPHARETLLRIPLAAPRDAHHPLPPTVSVGAVLAARARPALVTRAVRILVVHALAIARAIGRGAARAPS